MTALTTPAFWTRNYAFSRKMQPEPWLCRMDRLSIKYFHPYLKEKQNGQLIELGCGDSYWLPYFAKRYGYKVAGIDFSPERRKASAAKLELQGFDSSRVVCGDVTRPRYEWWGKFDVVYSRGVIEHFSDPAEMIRIFARYLKPDGIMITIVPHLKGFWGNLQKRLNRKVFDGHVCLDLRDTQALHALAGLQVVESRYYRWLDPSVLSWDQLPWLARKGVTAGCIGLDLGINLVSRVWVPKQLPEYYYSDILVVAKR